VRLAVYDVAGRLIRTLIDADLRPGAHGAIWDGRDSSGRGMESGSYVARLEAGGTVKTVALSLVR
jgi:flagellar hook assembly protein FlgD